MNTFIVFKYVNLILWKENYILGRIDLKVLGIWGEAELIFKDLGIKGKIFSGS